MRLELSKVSENDLFVLNIDTVRLVLQLPDMPWCGVTQICGRTISPVYKCLRDIVGEDMQNITRVLAGLEPADEFDFGDEESLEDPTTFSEPPFNPVVEDGAHDSFSSGTRRKRRRSYDANASEQSFIIPSMHASVPTIVVTPCPAEPRETSCHVPYQDAAFNNRLTVPTHIIFNEAFPPMMPPQRLWAPSIKQWKWQDGHWQASIPGLEEQARKGLFSRVVNTKRKAHRPPVNGRRMR